MTHTDPDNLILDKDFLPDAERRPVAFVTVDENHAGQRIDNFLITHLKGVPRTRIYRILRKGEVRVNKGRAKPEQRLQAGDVVRIPPLRLADRPEVPQAGTQLLSDLTSRILWEDKYLLVINKPAGLAVHGGSGVKLGLIEALRQLRPQEKQLELVHRLDRDTSGCLLVARRRSALLHLHAALREGTVDKRYMALVYGNWPAQISEITAPLLKNQLASGERIVRVSDNGKAAHTGFQVKGRYVGYTWVEASPFTGRTHQIRVHARHAGHPIVGDEKYAERAANQQGVNDGFKRLCLHASSVSFTVPGGGDTITVEAPLPDDLARPLSRLLRE
jgi:23S rRNA pseudouridine955/2504/2580 synthase